MNIKKISERLKVVGRAFVVFVVIDVTYLFVRIAQHEFVHVEDPPFLQLVAAAIIGPIIGWLFLVILGALLKISVNVIIWIAKWVITGKI